MCFISLSYFLLISKPSEPQGQSKLEWSFRYDILSTISNIALCRFRNPALSPQCKILSLRQWNVKDKLMKSSTDVKRHFLKEPEIRQCHTSPLRTCYGIIPSILNHIYIEMLNGFDRGHILRTMPHNPVPNPLL